jgi:peptidoglycan DL-endopeptidase LytF
MSRRDTIIIAVLVNAALLMILFATAIRSDHPKEDTKSQKKGDLKIEGLAVKPAVESPRAEDLLNEFVTSVPTLAENGEETLFSFDETQIASTSSPVIEVIEPLHLSPVAEEIKIVNPAVEEQVVHVTVKKGDFLEKIAKANNTTIAAIMKANNMSSTQLKVGQVLKVPLSNGKKEERKTAPAPMSNGRETEYYIVKEGDNPWLIASRNKINLEELLRLNGLDEQKAKRLRPGDKLKIR